MPTIDLRGITQAAALAAAAPATPTPAQKTISLKGISSAALSASAPSTGVQDPCANAQRLIALGHAKEAQPWLDQCNQQKALAAKRLSILLGSKNDPNYVAQQTYADATAQGATPAQAATYAQTAATQVAADNSQQDTAKKKNQQQLLGAAALAAVGFGVLNVPGAIGGAVLGFFAPDAIQKFKQKQTQPTTPVAGDTRKTFHQTRKMKRK